MCQLASWCFEPTQPQRVTHWGWNQTSIYLLLMQHKSHETAKFFKIHNISLDTNMKQNIKHQTKLLKKNPANHISPLLTNIRPGHAGIVDFQLIY